VEVPLRVAWHGSCFTAHACCCVPPCALLTAAQRTLAEQNNGSGSGNSSSKHDRDGDDDDDEETEGNASAATRTVRSDDLASTGAAIAAQATVCETALTLWMIGRGGEGGRASERASNRTADHQRSTLIVFRLAVRESWRSNKCSSEVFASCCCFPS